MSKTKAEKKAERMEAIKASWWNFRWQLKSPEAVRKYDLYCKEHARRLKQLYAEASGSMSPSGEWLRER